MTGDRKRNERQETGRIKVGTRKGGKGENIFCPIRLR